MLVLAMLPTILLAAGATNSFATEPESAFRGRRIAEANCAICHAIAQVDQSENPQAPPFRRLSRLASYRDLRLDLAGPLFLRHPAMPDFKPTREQVHDIVEYIESIQE